MNAISHFKHLEKRLNRISSLLKTNPEHLEERVEKLHKKVRELEREGGNSSEGIQKTIEIEELIENAQLIGNVKLVSKIFVDEELTFLRHLADQIRAKAKQSVLALFSTKDSKVNMVVALTKDLLNSKLDAKDMAQKVAVLLEGSAGGRKDLAQGGGRNSNGIEKAVEKMSQFIREGTG